MFSDFSNTSLIMLLFIKKLKKEYKKFTNFYLGSILMNLFFVGHNLILREVHFSCSLWEMVHSGNGEEITMDENTIALLG